MHTKSPSISISKIVYCNEEEPEKSGVCLSSEFDVGLPVTYFEKLDSESNKAQADTAKKCSAKTGESIEVFNGYESYKGTRLKNPTCKSWKKQMIAIVGEKDPKIEVLNFGKIEEAKKKKQ